jgi:hypothetical protein
MQRLTTGIASVSSLMADLPVFIRQSHPEGDEAALAERIVNEECGIWNLS